VRPFTQGIQNSLLYVQKCLGNLIPALDIKHSKKFLKEAIDEYIFIKITEA
jgi:hypothetical protein